MNYQNWFNVYFRKTYIFDILFWTSLFGFGLSDYILNNEPLLFSMRYSLALEVPLIIPVYLHHYIFNIFFVRQRNLLLYGLLTLTIIVFFGVINNYFGRIIMGEDHFNTNTLIILVLFIVTYTGLKNLKTIYTQQAVIDEEKLKRATSELNLREAEAKQMQTEIELLKLQINPHFLFNTLNNIYALALEKSGMLPDTILKLSNLMRYVLINSKEKFVSLERELAYIESYIELEQIRLSIPKNISFIKSGNIKGKSITPMLLTSFVENCFKHGVNSNSKIFELDLNVQIIKNKLIFKLSNALPPKFENKSMYKTKIGIQNAKRRLELLYPKLYMLNIKQDENHFKINLELTLDQKT